MASSWSRSQTMFETVDMQETRFVVADLPDINPCWFRVMRVLSENPMNKWTTLRNIFWNGLYFDTTSRAVLCTGMTTATFRGSGNTPVLQKLLKMTHRMSVKIVTVRFHQGCRNIVLSYRNFRFELPYTKWNNFLVNGTEITQIANIAFRKIYRPIIDPSAKGGILPKIPRII